MTVGRPPVRRLMNTDASCLHENDSLKSMQETNPTVSGGRVRFCIESICLSFASVSSGHCEEQSDEAICGKRKRLPRHSLLEFKSEQKLLPFGKAIKECKPFDIKRLGENCKRGEPFRLGSPLLTHPS